MIDEQLLLNWAKDLVLPAVFGWYKGPRQPEFGSGDRVAILTPQGGAGLTLEAIGDQPSFQVRMIAREHDVDLLKASAFIVDDELVRGDYPHDLWGTRVQFVTRVGGAPAPLQEDELDRVAYVCTYLVHETV